MTDNYRRISTIKGLSDVRRLPRLGIIRLGLKKKNAKGIEYPTETDYFVVPDEVAKVYSPMPKELDIMFPLNNPEAIFSQAYKFYGSQKGLQCQGDGEVAYFADKGAFKERECPCSLLEQRKCKQTGALLFMLPKVSVGGIYQITTSSYNSIVDINSGLDYIMALVGRISLVPIRLRRIPLETHHDEKKQTHYTLQLFLDSDLKAIIDMRADTNRVLLLPQYHIPGPREENPELDPPDIVEGSLEDPGEWTPPEESLAEIDLTYLRGLCIEAHMTEKEVCAHYETDGFEKIPKDQLNLIMDRLNARIERIKKFLEGPLDDSSEKLDCLGQITGATPEALSSDDPKAPSPGEAPPASPPIGKPEDLDPVTRTNGHADELRALLQWAKLRGYEYSRVMRLTEKNLGFSNINDVPAERIPEIKQLINHDIDHQILEREKAKGRKKT